MNKYFIDFYYDNNYNAGSKARDDISFYLKKNNFNPIMLKKGKSRLKNIINIIRDMSVICYDSIVIIQYPFTNTKIYNRLILVLLRIKKCKCILLIHDITSLRFKLSEYQVKREIKYINAFDIVISHNKKMSDWMRKNKFSKTYFDLNLFDYITEYSNEKKECKTNSIVFAGNLSREKSGFIYNLNDINIENISFNLYGVGIENSNYLESTNIIYQGKYKADELPGKLNGRYGLLWDGPSVEKCIGDFGDYLRYNNPHKLSLYLSANLPVIAWEEAAVSDFIKENNIGITINNLNELYQKINSITDKEYEKMKFNASNIGEKIRSGYYIESIIKNICE